MRYDLRIAGEALDLDAARDALGLEPGADEVVWARGGLAATILVAAESVEVGVSGAEAPAEERARDLRELLGLLLDVAERAGGRLHDEQLGRVLDAGGAEAAVEGFSAKPS